MSAPHESFGRILAVWQGEADADELDSLVTPTYVGHIGSRQRDLAQLKEDIAAYRAAAPGVDFVVAHQFASGDHVATRLTARVVDPGTGEASSACGINISRWEDGLLAEEWAVWESLSS